MKILLTDFPEGGKKFAVQESVTVSYDSSEVPIAVDTDLLLRSKSNVEFMLSGELKAELPCGCDRCGKPVLQTIRQKFDYILRVEEPPQFGAEYQCSDKDCETLYLSDKSVESSEIVEEQVLLALPQRVLCDENCKGLCDECGVDLNKKKCQCKEINRNSPFAVLQTLQKK